MTAQGFTGQGYAAPSAGGSAPATGAQAIIAAASDPARRQDVLLRVRREEGHEVSGWWFVGAFVAVSTVVVALMSLVPGGGI